MENSINLRRQQIKKYESDNFNLLNLNKNQEYVFAYDQIKNKKHERIAKSKNIKTIPTVYLCRTIEKILEGIQEYISTELSLYKADKNKYNIYWQFLESSMIFTQIECQIYIQDNAISDSDAFTSQVLRVLNFFIQSTHLLLDHADQDIKNNWHALFDYFSKIVHDNLTKMTKYKEIFSAQYFCLGYINNIINSFKKNEMYILDKKESEILTEITTQVKNQKMKEYILFNDDDVQDASSFEGNQQHYGIISQSLNFKTRENQQSAEFSNTNNQQQIKIIRLQEIDQIQNDISSKLYIANSDISQDKQEIKNDEQLKPFFTQSIQSEQISQFDSQGNKQSSLLGQTIVQSKEQNQQNLLKSDNSSNTNGSVKTKQIPQNSQTESTNQNNTQQLQIPMPLIQPAQNQKGKRYSILLPSSQFEFQSNIKSEEGMFPTNASNQAIILQDNSCLSQFLNKDDELIYQNEYNNAINNGFFSRKVSDNLLDDLDSIQQQQNESEIQSEKQTEVENKNNDVTETEQSSQRNSQLSSQLDSKLNQMIDGNNDEKEIEIKQKQEKIPKKLSKFENSGSNVRSREFSFKIDIKQPKKDGNGRTINEIEYFISKELAGLNEQINEFTQSMSADVHQHFESSDLHPTAQARLSNQNIIPKKSKVRGSNLVIGKVSSDLSAYDQHSSRIDERESSFTDSQDDIQSSDSQISVDSSSQSDQLSTNKRNSKTIPKKYKYTMNHHYDKDQIIQSNEEEEDEDEDEEDSNDDENESSSFENKQTFTRNRSNVQVQNKGLLKHRQSKHLEFPRQSLIKTDNLQTRKRSKYQEGIQQNESNSSKSQQNNSNTQEGSVLNEYELNQYEEELAQYAEIESYKNLTQEELSKIKSEIKEDFLNIAFNLDNTLLENGIAKNCKKYSFPLEINAKNKDQNRRLQERYKLIQNYQHLLGVDSNVFTNDSAQLTSMKKFVVKNNLEYLKMMNLIPQNEYEKLIQKKKQIQENKNKFQQNLKQPSKKNTFETTLKKMQQNEEQGGLEDIQEESSFIANQSNFEQKQIVSIKRNSEAYDSNRRSSKIKSQEQTIYNAHQDEIEEEDRFFYDEENKQGFTHQIYAVNKQNYFQEFKNGASQEILDRVFQMIEIFQKEENDKNIAQQLIEEKKDPFDFKQFDEPQDPKLAQYSLTSEIEKYIDLPNQKQLRQVQYNWNKAKIAYDVKQAEIKAQQNTMLNSLRHKKSVVISEDVINELALRQKNLSSSPTKKFSKSFKKARKRSGSLNPEANLSSDKDDSFASGIIRFQQQYKNSFSFTLQKVQGRQSLIS